MIFSPVTELFRVHSAASKGWEGEMEAETVQHDGKDGREVRLDSSDIAACSTCVHQLVFRAGQVHASITWRTNPTPTCCRSRPRRPKPAAMLAYAQPKPGESDQADGRSRGLQAPAQEKENGSTRF